MGAKGNPQVNIRVARDLHAAFEARLAERGESPGDVLVPAIEAYVSGAQAPESAVKPPRRVPAAARPYVTAMGAVLAQSLRPLAERIEALERAVAASGPPRTRTRPAADTGRAAPKGASRARAVSRAAASVDAADPRAALKLLRGVTPGTPVFREPGGEPVAGHPVPPAADHSGKRGLR